VVGGVGGKKFFGEFAAEAAAAVEEDYRMCVRGSWNVDMQFWEGHFQNFYVALVSCKVGDCR
jgi:hypothetical protein